MKKTHIFALLFVLMGVVWVSFISYQGYLPSVVSLDVKKIFPPIKIKPKNPYMEELVRDFEKQFKRNLRRTGTPGASLVIVLDSMTYLLDGYGIKSKRNRKDSVDAHTVFRLGSVSKSFASVLAGTFEEEGAIAWDDKVQLYVPEFRLRYRKQSGRVELKHILSHTSGLKYHSLTYAIESGYDMEEQIIPRLRKMKIRSKEGRRYSYQNAIYSVIGTVLENKTGESYNDLLTERILEPLGMDDASLTYEGIKENPNHARPHYYKRKRYRYGKINKKYYNAVPAGGVNASAADMAQYLQLLLGNREDIISKETLAELYTPQIRTRSRDRRKYFGHWDGVRNAHYGLGFRIAETKQDTFIYHGGWVNDYKADIAIHPKDKIGICVLSNAPTKFSSSSIPQFLRMYKKKRDLIQNWKPEEEELDAVERKAFL